jgi:uncharacterized protein (TIGR02246 family)
MLTKLFLSGIAFTGGALLLATADEPAPQNAASKSRSQNAVSSKAPVSVEELPESEADEEEASPLIAPKESPDQPAIKLVDDAFVKAYEAGDAKAIVACFTADAEYVDETGTVFEGRESIEACLTAFFEENPGCKLEIHADSVRTISPGVVVEDGSTLVSRTDGSTPVECQYTSIYVKTDGKWLVASVRDHVPRGLREHSSQLKQLNWLSGDWVDEGDDSLVNFSCESVDNGNFLLRKFTIVVGGEEAMSGTQRIGWDPLTRKLRAWIFDSEGAYAEGLWHQDPENNRWILKTTGVTADGETASSTSIYTFVNEHTMTWQSVDHEIAGVQQPDSDVITIVRHSPGPTPVIAADARD